MAVALLKNPCVWRSSAAASAALPRPAHSAQRGVTVRLFEQAPALAEVGAGVALQPNGIRMLRQLGLGGALLQWGARWLDPQFRRSDGSFIACMWPPELGNEIEFYGMHRADLLHLFVERLPADVVATDHKCVGFEQDEHEAILAFANGRRAGRRRRHCRRWHSFKASGIRGRPVRPTAFGLTRLSRSHSGGKRLLAARGHAQLVGGGQAFSRLSGALRRPHQLRRVRANRRTNARVLVDGGDPVALAQAFAGWDPMVEAITAQASMTFRWGLYDREPLSAWTRGRLTLLGDAAHPMLPPCRPGGQPSHRGCGGIGNGVGARRPEHRTAGPAHLRACGGRGPRASSSAHASMARAMTGPAGDLGVRDQQLAAQSQERAWIWNYDAGLEAAAAAAAL